MGTLSNIRKISPYALGLFAIIFIGYMVLSDADISTLIRSGESLQNAVVGKVNGEKILYTDYEDRVRAQIEQQRAQMQDPNQEIDESTVRQQVWDQLVDNLLFKQEAKKMGIVVTPDEIRDELIENPPDYLKKSFTDSSGKFLRDIYLQLITNPESYRNYLGSDQQQVSEEEKTQAVNQLRKDLSEIESVLARNKMFAHLQTSVGMFNSIASPTFAKVKYVNQNSSMDAKILVISPKNVNPENIKISESEIQQYYNAHKSFYKQEAQVQLKYITFPLKPSKEDSARADKRARELDEALKNAKTVEERDSIFNIKMSELGGETFDYTPVNKIDPEVYKYLMFLPDKYIAGPLALPEGITYYKLDGRRPSSQEIVRANHILIKINNNKDSAYKRALEIIKEIKSGKDFTILARQYSQDPGSAQNGGDLGYFGRGQMVKPFEDAVFSAKVGEVVGPIETDFGYHIIKVYEKNPEELKYSKITIKNVISNATKNALFRESYSISKQLQDGGNIDTIAKRLNRVVNVTPYFTQERPIFNSWYITNKAFDLDVGEVIEPIELKYYGIFVGQVVGKKKAGIASLEDKRDEIEAKLRDKKLLDMAKSQAEQIYAKVKSLQDLEQAWQMDTTLKFINATGLKNDGKVQGIGNDIILTQKIFDSPIGQILSPIRGERNYYIIQVLNKQIPDAQIVQANLDNYIKQLTAEAAKSAFFSWYTEVKKSAKIKDYRSKYYKDF
ncbi:MAG TPA: peptidylprolyl isomerase [Candidatus Kapabacteria bacterium]|jgi:parvulin-like peptidyl-prolyl isomerase|nr:peptidylprolyl isomerase [Candidatus Kapabacteria bacterium]HOV91495.1 peptidylprolyl isomerase [Candidatus Kapabacteria bacterium]